MIETETGAQGPFVSELREGIHVVGFYHAREPVLQSFREAGRGSFLEPQLVDRSGTISARLWEGAEEGLEAARVTGVVKIEGDVERFRDHLQIRVLRMRSAETGEFDPADLTATARRPVAEMNAAIDQAVASIRDPHLSALVRHFFEEAPFRTQLERLPAGRRVHHAYRGGLLEHIFEVLSLSHPLIELYPEIDADLLTAGILLHDIGKLQELGGEDGMEYTDAGRLVGHVVIGAEQVAQAVTSIPGFPNSRAMQLHHLILAHHGRFEWGSPRRPKTLEAVALHHLENLDGQVNRFRSLIEAARLSGRTWTEYDSLLERALYAGGGDLSPEEAGQAS
jgi:3'-5' exoribonuclease